MLTKYSLNFHAELDYARRWAYARNPAYYNFDAIGGDCTNFISQCLYAGGAVMNFKTDTGWYYISPQNRAPAWTGVEYFYRFLVRNQGVGPFGRQISLADARPGDVLQLGDGQRYYHSLLVLEILSSEPYLAAHTADAYMVSLSHYRYATIRCLHVEGSRRWEP